MKYFQYLKKGFIIYITSGLVLGALLFSLAALYGYNGYLDHKLETARNITHKKTDIKRQIAGTDSLSKYFRDNFSMDETGINSERLILQALDEMKTNLEKASISMSGMEETENEKRLPVEIKAPVKSYKMIVDYVGYVESFRLPDYRIKNVAVSKEQSGEVILNIQGELVAPVIKTEG